MSNDKQMTPKEADKQAQADARNNRGPANMSNQSSQTRETYNAAYKNAMR